MATKAYKLNIPEIKMLCDFFKVDRSQLTNKEDLIDRLLDFLSAPDPELTKKAVAKKKAAPGKKRAAKGEAKAKTGKKKKTAKAADEDETEDEDMEDEEEEEGKMPSDKALRKWVQAYVGCFNLNKATTRHAMETASDKFGVDLSSKKERIKELLAEEML